MMYHEWIAEWAKWVNKWKKSVNYQLDCPNILACSRRLAISWRQPELVSMLHELGSNHYWFPSSYVSTRTLTFVDIYIMMILTFSVLYPQYFQTRWPKSYASLNILNEVIRVHLGERELSKLFLKSGTSSTPGVQLRILSWKEGDVSWPDPSDPVQEFQGEATPPGLCSSQNKELTTLQSRASLIYSSDR